MKRLTLEDFLNKAKQVHINGKYNYDLVQYKNSKTKIKIICLLHGEFEQRPDQHLAGYGCCKGANKRKSLILEEFIKNSKNFHENKFNYDLVEYVNNKTKVKILCPDHGVFEQFANSHMQGAGCISCSNKKPKTTESFIKECKEVHNDFYDYSLVEYKGIFSKVKIVCPYHGEFEQASNHHVEGRGCSGCAVKGFDPNKPSILYFLKFSKKSHTFWKIGVTNRSLKDRFRADFKYIKEQFQWSFPDGRKTICLEEKVLAMFYNYKFKSENRLLKTAGDTECFTTELPFDKVIQFINAERLL